MGKIDNTGYLVKTENEYFTEQKQMFQDIDASWNLDPSSPDGLKIAKDSETFADLDEAGLIAYNSKDPNKAIDVELDVVSSITGTFRIPGTSSTVSITIGGVVGAVIYAGDIIKSTVDGTEWAIDATVTIGGGGTVVAQATAMVTGAIEADTGTITKIVTARGGWQTVTNTVVAVTGTPRETNAQLRFRRFVSVARPGDNQVDSMYGEIGAVADVRHVEIYENDTNATDADGLPAHSIAPIVDGGTDAAVALAIYLKKNPGVFLHPAGTPVNEIVTSPLYSNNTKNITFSRPVYVAPLVVVDVTDDGTLPVTAGDEIKKAILAYANGTLIDENTGFNILGFTIGEDVTISRMYTPVNQVIGSYGNSYVTNITLDGGSINVAIAFNELSQWLLANLTVNIT